MKKYETFDHTADLGIRVFGETKEELFANAGYALFDNLAELKNVQLEETLRIKQGAPGLEELFLSWLSELLYQYNSKEMIFKEFAIDKLTEEAISARVQGEKLDRRRHRLKTEIKAVTYHELKVQKLKDCWQGQVIFDV